MLSGDIEKVLVSEEELDAIVTRLANEINRDYKRTHITNQNSS